MLLPDDTAEADMAHPGVDRLRVPCGRAIAAAVARRAEVRSALDHLARNAAYRIPRIDTAGLCPTAGIGWNATGGPDVMAGREPVRRPFPDIADHVEQPIAIGGKTTHRRGSDMAIEREILLRECPLPDIGHVAAVRRQLIAPGEFGALKAAAGGEFP